MKHYFVSREAPDQFSYSCTHCGLRVTPKEMWARGDELCPAAARPTPATPEQHLHRGYFAAALGEKVQALSHFYAAWEQDAYTDPKFACTLSLAYLNDGHPHLARVYAEDALRFHPTHLGLLEVAIDAALLLVDRAPIFDYLVAYASNGGGAANRIAAWCSALGFGPRTPFPSEVRH